MSNRQKLTNDDILVLQELLTLSNLIRYKDKVEYVWGKISQYEFNCKWKPVNRLSKRKITCLLAKYLH